MKITLQVNGREMTFSEKELTSILEEYFSSAQKPTEGKLFEVRPQTIDQTLFKEEREDKAQESTRQSIVAAFKELKRYPKRYGKDFKTLMPVKNWTSSMTVSELKDLSCKLGGHTANWVEQALEWAQRISNGETWKEVCNKPDTANWCRLVIWTNGYTRSVGGSRIGDLDYASSHVSDSYYFECFNMYNTVPLVVI